MQKHCFAISLVLVTNERVEQHMWNLVQVYDEHVYRPDHKMIPVGAGVCGAVLGVSGYRGYYWTATGRSNRQFQYCTQAENFMRLE